MSKSIGIEQRMLAIETTLVSLLVSYVTSASGNAANVLTSVQENAAELAGKVHYQHDELSSEEMEEGVQECISSIFRRLEVHPADFDVDLPMIDSVYADVVAANLSLAATLSVLAPTAEQLEKIKERALALVANTTMTADTPELNERMFEAIEKQVGEVFDGANALLRDRR